MSIIDFFHIRCTDCQCSLIFIDCEICRCDCECIVRVCFFQFFLALANRQYVLMSSELLTVRSVFICSGYSQVDICKFPTHLSTQCCCIKSRISCSIIFGCSCSFDLYRTFCNCQCLCACQFSK